MNPVKNSSLSLIDGSELKVVIDSVSSGNKLSDLNNIHNEDITSSNPVWTTSYDYGSANFSDPFGDYDEYYWYNWWWSYCCDYPYDFNSNQDNSYQQSVNAFGDYMEGQMAWENDEWSEKIERFEFLFQNQSKETRKKLGHSIQNMLITCSFNGKKCSAVDFTLFQTTEYGNCYTLSSDLFITRKTGPMNGLQLILQVEKFELSNLFDGSGFRLVIHEPGTFPFPQDEGYTISPGYETTIGMRMLRVMHAEPPYGICDSGDVFFETYGFRYTMQACLQICRNKKVVEICKCRPSKHMDIKFMEKFNTTPICSSSINSKNEKGTYSNAKQCEEFIYFRIDEHYIDCECATPCSQTLYRSTICGRVWPKESFLEKELLNTQCEQSNYSYCDMYLGEKNSAFKDNFLKLVIYYEDMNYEEISEEPSYDGFRFLSDLGGAMGLFLGASLLSFLELVQLMVELFNYQRHKCRKRKIKANESPNIIVKPTKDTTVINNIFTVAKKKNETV
ncbi:FMRFamide-activated amiloride-sensitive sodium channel-like [Saccostrea echinata]|uniref:FMRFamide-activated amiloride-sensitive sodium channel-like n=1 Tax=Saccostrea echinata TaxID=191078 RepID=UPI002A826501|nr:FMRFamide-activated amiloride-sensitive sodium channel-like [Saccostrea echinata]